jgi:hypothetical protein
MIEFGDLLFHKDIEWAKARYFSTWNPYFEGDNGQWLGHYIWFSWLMQLGDSETVERLLLLSTLVFLGLSAFNVTFAFTKRIFQKIISVYGSSIAATFIAMLNPWITTRMSQPPYIWMVASSFLLFYFVDKAIREENRRNVIKDAIPASFALVFGSVVFYSLFYLGVFVGLLVILEIIFADTELRIKVLNGILFLSGLSLFSTLLFSFYLFPSFFAFMPKYATGVPWRVESTLFQMRGVWRNSQIENVFRLSGHWVIGVEFYKGNVISNDLWILSTLVVPVIALAALWLKPQERLVQIANIVAVVFLLIASLPKGPLRWLFFWLIERGSLVFDMFRETDRFAGALITAYAIMGGVTTGTLFEGVTNKKRIGILVNRRIRFIPLIKRVMPLGVIPILVVYSIPISELINLQQIASFLIFFYILLAGVTALKNRFKGMKRQTLGAIFLLVVCGSTALSAYPLLSGNLSGYFQPINLPMEYEHANEWLKAQEDDSLVLWLPPVFEYEWASHRLVPELRYWVTSKPTLIASVPPYKRHFENFIYDTLLFNRSSQIGKLLSLANIGYILYHNDSIDASEYNAMFRSLLSQRDLSLVFKEGNVFIFKNQWEQKSVKAVNKTLLIIGGLDALIPLLNFEFFKPDEFAIFFLDQKPLSKSTLQEITQLPSYLLIYGNKDFHDVVLDTIGEQYYYAPYDYFTPTSDPWRADMMYSWLGPRAAFNNYPKGPRYDFDLEKKFIFTEEKNATFNFKIDIVESNEYEIWIRIFLSPRGGKISLNIDDVKSFFVFTNSPDKKTLQGFKWIKMGSLFLDKGSHNITITNHYGLTWINVIATAPTEEVQRHADFILNLLRNKNVSVIYLQDESSLTLNDNFKEIFQDDSFSPSLWNAEAGKWMGDKLVYTVESVEWETVNDVLYTTGPFFRFIYVRNVTLFDGAIEALVKVDNNGTAPYLGFRAQGVNNLYIFGFAPWMRMVELSKFVNGQQTRICSSFLPIEVNKWYKLKVEFKGEIIRCFIDDQLILEATDSTFTSGTIGFWVYNLDAYLKEFKIIAPVTSIVLNNLPFQKATIALHIKSTKNYEPMLVTTIRDGKLYMEILNSTGWKVLKPFDFNTTQRIELLLVSPHNVNLVVIHPDNENSSSAIPERLLSTSYTPEITTFQGLSPVRYNVKANASTPYILVFKKLYDNLWQGFSNDGSLTKIQVPVYSIYNAFFVGRPDSSSITVDYIAEKYFHMGVTITATTLVLSICLYLLLTVNYLHKRLKSFLIIRWLKEDLYKLKKK